jgi:hypothetical protein
MSTTEMHSRIYTLFKMMANERLCRVKMVLQQPDQWATIQQSTFTELREVCGICITALDIELERRQDNQELTPQKLYNKGELPQM